MSICLREFSNGNNIILIERIQQAHIESTHHILTLEKLEVGESIFCDELKKAHSLRVLSYYLVKTRNLSRKYTFRKMDKGWRIIRTR